MEDVRSRSYYRLVSQELKRGKSGLQQIQNDVNTEYVFVQCFSMGSRAGCVTVAQAEEDIMGGRAAFWSDMYPVFVAGPLLFLLLVFLPGTCCVLWGRSTSRCRSSMNAAAAARWI